MNDDSKYKFRFGTYASNNALYTEVKTETEKYETIFNIKDISTASASEVTNCIGSSTTLLNQLNSIITSSTNSATFNKVDSDSRKVVTLAVNTPIFKNENTLRKSDLFFALDYECIEAVGGEIPGYTRTGQIQLSFRFSKDGSLSSQTVRSDPWKVRKKTAWNVGEKITEGSLVLKLSKDFLSEKNDDGGYVVEPKQLIIQFKSAYKCNIKISNFRAIGLAGGEPIVVQKYVKQDGKYIYTCPWELKHIDSITMSVSGQTATMGIPNKPSSRTQIFDTGGPVRTFKISGKRYDHEERVCNWNFVNEQLNMAYDDEYPGKLYTYVGISWMLSTMQILLKGYTFNIKNDDYTDLRYIGESNPVITTQPIPGIFSSGNAIKVKTLTELRNNYSNKDGLYNDLYGYVTQTKKYYKGVNNGWEEFKLREDVGFNVALTGFSANYSESSPGLMEYSLTAVERFRNGNNIYNVYNPIYTEEKP